MTEEVAQLPPHRQPDVDRMLARAWELMFYYDHQAVEARRTFNTSRYRLIVMTFASTATAVFAAWFIEVNWLYVVLTALAFALPIVAGASVKIAQQFERVSAWLKHRIVAERIRSEIYLYRMRAKNYAEGEPHEADNMLNAKLGELQRMIDTDDFHAANTRKDDQWLDNMYAEIARDDKYGDNGHQQLSIEDYLRIRGEGQRDWYLKRVERDYHLYRRLNVISTFVQISGSIFVALIVLLGFDGRFITFPTLTNAASFALAAYVNVRLTGQVYGVFNMTRRELDTLLGEWEAFQNDPDAQDQQKRKAKEKELVTRIEDTLSWEREEWYRVALQTLSANDENLFKAVEKLHKGRNSTDDKDKANENNKS